VGDDAKQRCCSISDVQMQGGNGGTGTANATNLFRIGDDGTSSPRVRPSSVLPGGNALTPRNGLAYDTTRSEMHVLRTLVQNFTTALGGWAQGGRAVPRRHGQRGDDADQPGGPAAGCQHHQRARNRV
jgi:hypothetical protein